jgi:hypothetical protein
MTEPSNNVLPIKRAAVASVLGKPPVRTPKATRSIMRGPDPQRYFESRNLLVEF